MKLKQLLKEITINNPEVPTINLKNNYYKNWVDVTNAMGIDWEWIDVNIDISGFPNVFTGGRMVGAENYGILLFPKLFFSITTDDSTLREKILQTLSYYYKATHGDVNGSTTFVSISFENTPPNSVIYNEVPLTEDDMKSLQGLDDGGGGGEEEEWM